MFSIVGMKSRQFYSKNSQYRISTDAYRCPSSRYVSFESAQCRNVYVKMHNGLKERKYLFQPCSLPGTTGPTVESFCADYNVHNIYNDPNLYMSIEITQYDQLIPFKPFRQGGPRQCWFYTTFSVVLLQYLIITIVKQLFINIVFYLSKA